MVAIVTGNGLGLSSGSLTLGQAGLGRSGEQNYVNLATGNLVLQQQDELLLGQGPDLNVVRTYNSRGTWDGDNNDNWRIGFVRRLSGFTGAIVGPQAEGGSITRTGADGAELLYTWDSSRSAYVNKDGSGSYDTLTYSSSAGQWTWTDGDSRITEIYDWAGGVGKLQSLSDTDGNAIAYVYNAAGLLVSIVSSSETSSNQNHTTLVYSGTQLTEITTSAYDVLSGANQTLTRTRYTYDSNGRLWTAAVDLSPTDSSISDGKTYVTTYTYHADGSIATLTQTDGTQIAYTYTSGKVTQITQTLAGSARVTNINYDTTNRKTTVTDPLGNATVYTYDTAGQLTNILAPAVGGVSQSVSYEYNTNGDITKQIDARNQPVVYEYDNNGNLTLQRDFAGNTIKRTYGNQNELLTETVYLTPDPDGAASGAPDQPLTTRYAYDNKNHLRFVVSAEGRVTEYRYEDTSQSYDGKGQRTASITYTGNTYNLTGLAITATLSESTLAAWVAGSADKTRSQRTDYTYDFRGNLASSTVYAETNSSGVGVAAGAATTQYVLRSGRPPAQEHRSQRSCYHWRRQRLCHGLCLRWFGSSDQHHRQPESRDSDPVRRCRQQDHRHTGQRTGYHIELQQGRRTHQRPASGWCYGTGHYPVLVR
ncbi:MAG: DUF6531 domain-containing protein [Rhodocyclaceae bacterium]